MRYNTQYSWCGATDMLCMMCNVIRVSLCLCQKDAVCNNIISIGEHNYFKSTART